MNTPEIRALFPVTKEATYLNSASQAPLNTLVNNRLQEHLKMEQTLLGKKGFDRNRVRKLLAELLGGTAEEYALVTSTGVGMGIVANGLKFEAGDNVVLPEKEHWNNIFPWLELQRKGVEVRFAKLNADNSFDPEAFEQLINARTKVVALAAVRFNSGFRPNLKVIGEMAHAKGALFVVDAAQAAGMVPLNVEELNIDVMAGCGFKWLLGMHGTGYLYVNRNTTDKINAVMPGMFAATHDFYTLDHHSDARKFETGTIAYSLFDAWTAGLELVKQIGINNIYNRAIENTTVLIEGLQNKNYNIITPTRTPEERTSIVHFNTGSPDKTKALHQSLTAQNIILTLQGENLRVSPNFFTTAEELERFLNYCQ